MNRATAVSPNYKKKVFHAQSFESKPGLGAATTSLTSLSLVSNSHAGFGGTSTAGEQLKNPCGCQNPRHFKQCLPSFSLSLLKVPDKDLDLPLV